MTQTISNHARWRDQPSAMSSAPVMAAAIVIGSTLVGAFLFRTYSYEVTPRSWEVVRHFNIFFMLCELAVVWLAFRAGLDVPGVWTRLGKADKAALLLWGATFWIGSLLSDQPVYSLMVASSWPIHLLFGLSVWHLARRTAAPTEHGTRLIGVGIAMAVVGLLATIAVHFLQAPDPTGLPNGQVFWPGAVPGFLSVRLFGVVVAYAALFGAGMLIVGDAPRRWLLPVTLLMFGFGAMCWSSTRAAVPAFFVALLCVPWAAGCRPTRRVGLIVSGAIVAAFAFSIFVPAPVSSFGTLQLFAAQPPGAVGDITNGRVEIWQLALSGIAEQPLIGQGEGSIRWLIESNNGGHVQPHNLVLQVFLHWGAIAGCAAIWLAGRLVMAMTASVRRDRATLPYAMIVTAAFVAALFDGALYYPHMVMFPVAALAYALARDPLERSRTQTARSAE